MTLVSGVVERRAEIDALLSSLSVEWPLDRMPAVDRNVLRIGVWELLHGGGEVPEGVAISEAVALVTSLSTDESPRFVNGVLARVAKDRPEPG